MSTAEPRLKEPLTPAELHPSVSTALDSRLEPQQEPHPNRLPIRSPALDSRLDSVEPHPSVSTALDSRLELDLYSINCKGIKEATSDLINNTAESLIRYIYRTHYLGVPDREAQTNSSDSEDYVISSPDVRIGLSIRILVKADCSFDEPLIELILKDIESLRHDTDYLLSFSDPKARRHALEEEYALVQGYIDMDDTISLNQEIGEDTVVPSRNMYQMADRGGCNIQ